MVLSQISSFVQSCVTGTMADVELVYVVFMIIGGVLGGTIGSRINKKISEKGVDRLFIFLMAVIVVINIYNAIKFGVAAF